MTKQSFTATWRLLGIASACVVVMGFLPACETSSHKSVKTYEYNDDPPPEKRSESKELDSDWKMESEGEMTGDPTG